MEIAKKLGKNFSYTMVEEGTVTACLNAGGWSAGVKALPKASAIDEYTETFDTMTFEEFTNFMLLLLMNKGGTDNAAIEAAVQEMIADGTMQKIYDQWNET